MCRQSIFAIELCIEPRRAAAMPISTAIMVASWPCAMYLSHTAPQAEHKREPREFAK